MKTAAATGAHIVRLSALNDIDPFVVVALLAIQALAAMDFAKVRFWKDVSERLRRKISVAI